MIMPKGYTYSTAKTWTSVHAWVRKAYGSAKEQDCSWCGEKAQEWAFTYPDKVIWFYSPKGAPYTLDIRDYQPMCKSCHWKHDAEKDPEMAERRTARSAEIGRKNAGRTAWNKGLKQNGIKYQCNGCGMVGNSGSISNHRKNTMFKRCKDSTITEER